jgi:ketosteroid isomerase-like protein
MLRGPVQPKPRDTAPAMSQSHLDVVRILIDAGNREASDWALAEYFTEDAEFEPAPEFAVMSQPVFRGHAGLARAWAQFHEAFTESRQEILDLTDAGDHVLAVVRWTVRGQTSDAEVTFDLFEDYEFRGSKVSRMRFFLEREKALEAAGLAG